MSPRLAARLRLAGILFVALLAQTTLGDDLRFHHVAPDFLLLLSVCAGLTGGPARGMIVGFVAGLASDATLTDTPLGLSALTFLLAGGAVGALRSSVFRESRVLRPVLAFVGTVVGIVLFVAIGDLVGEHQLVAGGRAWLIRVALVEAVWNGALALPACWLLRHAAHGLPGPEPADVARQDRLALR
jgi:rod shape-determining protein MreD